MPLLSDLPPDLTRQLRLLGLAAFASMASMRWCDALLPVLAAELNSTAGQTGTVVYGFAITYSLMQLVSRPVGDRFGQYTVVSFATLACTLGALASALAPSLGWLTLARVLTGATAAGVIPLTLAWVGDNVPWEQRQPVLARLMAATVSGNIAGQWLSGVFAAWLGWRSGFVAVAPLFAGAGLALRRGLGARAAQAAAVDDGLSSLQRARQVLASRAARCSWASRSAWAWRRGGWTARPPTVVIAAYGCGLALVGLAVGRMRPMPAPEPTRRP